MVACLSPVHLEPFREALMQPLTCVVVFINRQLICTNSSHVSILFLGVLQITIIVLITIESALT